MRAHYLDTSALVKLVVHEPESSALREWLAQAEGEAVSCDLARAELMRAVRRVDPMLATRARDVLDAISLIRVTPGTFEAAGRLDPTELQSLDALHLAAALQLGDDLSGLVCYDSRLSLAATEQGIRIFRPA